MILDRLKRLKADVWFSFSGIAYGCECRVDECTNNTITLHILYCPKYKNFFKILPKFYSKSFDKVRCELRVYFPKHFSCELKSGKQIVFETFDRPIILEERLHEIQMKFINLVGVSVKDQLKWKNVLSYEFKSGFEHF